MKIHKTVMPSRSEPENILKTLPVIKDADRGNRRESKNNDDLFRNHRLYPAVMPQPDSPQSVYYSNNTRHAKIADPDIIEFDDESVPIEIITDLTFEQVGGQEIINIARNDLINGQNVLYRPIKNLQETYLRYNPKNIVGLQQTSEEIFRNFPIKLASYIPEEGSGPGGSFVYLDAATGNIVVDLVNTRPGEQVDIEVVNQASTFDDTIYVEGNS